MNIDFGLMALVIVVFAAGFLYGSVFTRTRVAEKFSRFSFTALWLYVLLRALITYAIESGHKLPNENDRTELTTIMIAGLHALKNLEDANDGGGALHFASWALEHKSLWTESPEESQQNRTSDAPENSGKDTEI